MTRSASRALTCGASMRRSKCGSSIRYSCRCWRCRRPVRTVTGTGDGLDGDALKVIAYLHRGAHGLGSAVVIGTESVATTCHVLHRAQRVEVERRGRKWSVRSHAAANPTCSKPRCRWCRANRYRSTSKRSPQLVGVWVRTLRRLCGARILNWFLSLSPAPHGHSRFEATLRASVPIRIATRASCQCACAPRQIQDLAQVSAIEAPCP